MTEREVVLREREAYIRGALTCRPGRHGECEEIAAKIYPLPTVTRPRVVADPHAHSTSWTIRDGELTVVFGPTEKPWSVSGPNDGYKPTHERIALWAALLATPNETVEDA